MSKRLAWFALYFIVFGFAGIIVQLVQSMADLRADLDADAEDHDRQRRAVWRRLAAMEKRSQFESGEAPVPASATATSEE